MGLYSKSGALALNVATGHQSVDVGFTPKLVIFQSTPDTSNIVSSIANGHWSFGAFDGTLQTVQASNVRHSTSTSDTARYTDITNVIYVADPPGTMTPDYIASAYSLNSNGFTINITNAPPINYRFGYLALGGSDIDSVRVGTFASKGSTGSQSITGLGFKPDVVICFLSGTYGGMPVSSPDSSVGIGFANGLAAANQFAMGTYNQDAVTDILAAGSTCKDASIIFCPLQKTFISLQATLTSFDAGGFTLNWVAHSPVANINISYIAIKGGAGFSSRIGRVQLSGVTGGIVSPTGFGFAPKCGLFASASVTTLGGTFTAGDHHSMGWVDINRNMFHTAKASRFYAGFLNAWHTSHDLHTYRYIAYNNSQIFEEATLQSWDADGFTMFSDVGSGSTGSLVGYLVFNGSDVVPPPQPILEQNTGIYV